MVYKEMFILVGLSLFMVVKATLISCTSCFSSFGFGIYVQIYVILLKILLKTKIIWPNIVALVQKKVNTNVICGNLCEQKK